MTKNATRRPTPRKSTVRKPTDHQPKTEPEVPALTENDFKVDSAKVLPLMGIDPSVVIENTVKIAMVNGVLVLEYGVRKAIPPRLMGMALIQGTMDTPQEEPDGHD